eukprot:5329534-Pleurochrysis_carterae.AAC.4
MQTRRSVMMMFAAEMLDPSGDDRQSAAHSSVQPPRQASRLKSAMTTAAVQHEAAAAQRIWLGRAALLHAFARCDGIGET